MSSPTPSAAPVTWRCVACLSLDLPALRKDGRAAVHIVVMGCGRVGSGLALQLAKLDHTVAVIDQDDLAFRRLGDDFPGQTVEGVGFDRNTLIAAGIEQAGAFAAVSSGDNSNII